MKLKKILFVCLLSGGSLQASIIYNQTTGLGLQAGEGIILQNFTSPSLDQQSLLASSGNVATQFAGLTLTANSNLYYDPNGSGGCGLGKGTVANPTMPNLAACVGNYSLQGAPANSNEGTPLANMPAQADLTMGFASPVFSASFLFAAPSAGPGTLTYEVRLFKADGTTQVDTTTFLKATLASPNYMVITESQAFSFVEITQLANSGPGITPVTGEGTTGYTFNALIGDVQASNLAPVPEPGTIGLLSLGLGGLGYLVRRRKA